MNRIALELDSFAENGIMPLPEKFFYIRRHLPSAFPRAFHPHLDMFFNISKIIEEVKQCRKIILLVEYKEEGALPTGIYRAEGLYWDSVLHMPWGALEQIEENMRDVESEDQQSESENVVSPPHIGREM